MHNFDPALSIWLPTTDNLEELAQMEAQAWVSTQFPA